MKAVLRTAWVVAHKELRGGVRDKRSLISAFLFPLFGPVVLLFTFSSISDIALDEAPLTIAMAGETAPALAGFLEDSGARVERFDGDVEAAIKAETHDFVIRIPKGFSTHVQAEKRTEIELVMDPSNPKSRTRARRVKRLLNTYASTVSTARLRARGLDPSINTPFVVAETSVVKDHNPLKSALSIIGTFLLLAVYIGGMYLAMDITTGERERGSLEALLSTAAPRFSIVLGKSAAIATFAFASIVLTMTLFFLVMSTLPMDKMGIAVPLGVATWLKCILLSLPWILAAAALQHLIGTIARSIKEAQMLLSLLMFAPLAPSIFLTISPGAGGLLLMAIPGVAQQELVLNLLTGTPISAIAVALSLGSCAVLTIGSLWAGHRSLAKEKVIFGG